MHILYRIRVMIWRLRPALGGLALAACLLLPACAATHNAIASAAGLPTASNIQILTGNLDADLFRNLMSVRAALVQLNAAAVGDPLLTGVADRLDADFNAVLAHVAHYRAIFGIAGAAIAENVKLQGQPVDWSQLQPVGPVPLALSPKPPGK